MAVVRSRSRRQLLHNLIPRVDAIKTSVQQTSLNYRRRHSFQIVKRQLRQRIFRSQNLALFGNLNSPVNTLSRLSQNGLVSRPAAAPYRTASAVKNPQLYIVFFRNALQSLLSFVDFPIAAEETRIFIAVRIAQHHLLQFESVDWTLDIFFAFFGEFLRVSSC